MKRIERLLAPMIMAGVLVLSGCASSTSTLTSGKVVLPSIVGVDGTKTIIGKIVEIIPTLFVHPPRRAFCRIWVVSDNGEKIGIFIPKATSITDLSGKDISGKWPRVGERVEVKYYTLEPGVDDRTYTVSIRYVPSDYVQQPVASMIPAKTVPSTSAPTPGSSFQPGDKIPADKAVVYIYRPSGSTGGKAMPFGVRVSDKVITTQVQGGYYAYLTEPGNIEFTVFEIGLMAPKSTSSITVDAKAGLAYYLKGSHGKGAGGRAHLELVSPEVGANEIANCKLTTTQ